MARGEQSKSSPRGPGLAMFAVFVACCVGALTMVASATRGCAGCGSPVAVPVAASEPFIGARAAFGELGWRDAARGRPLWSAPTAPDGAAAEAALDATLRARGYVETPRDEAARDLPFEVATDALEGTCGVVAVLGVGTATLTELTDSEQGSVRAPDPSVVTIARCGVGAIRASGLGRAVVRSWQMPGITPEDVADTGLPADVVLAHAEAEALLRPHGLEPAPALAPETTAVGHTVSPPGHRGTSGCTAWVGVVLGAGRAETSGSSYGVIGRDHAIDRAMIGAASCAGTGSTWTALVDEGGDGWTIVWRPYGRHAGGPTHAASGAIVPTVGAARVVSIAELPAVVALPEAAAPP